MPEKVPAGWLAWAVVFLGAARLASAVYVAVTTQPLGWAGSAGLAASTVFALTCFACAATWWLPFPRSRTAHRLALAWLAVSAGVVLAAFAITQGAGAAAWAGTWLTWLFTLAVTVILSAGLVSHTRPAPAS